MMNSCSRSRAALALALFASSAASSAHAKDAALAGIDAIYPELDTLYRDLHQNPELSGHEEKTAAKLADRLRRLGYDVTTGVGGHGIVALMRNGNGPAVMLRTDMDALPVEEKTGLPYASKVTAPGPTGSMVPVMHACGHDIHMSSLIGAATLLARMKDRWNGTLMLIGQPAEETLSGAEAMIKDGLFTRFPKPAYAVAIHDTSLLPAGTVGYTPGNTLSNLNTVSITIHGRGGHGAYPHKTIDPIVIAARTVLALQTIVAREINPLDPAVVTVGSIQGGTKANIIPDDVTLLLTVRSYKEEVRKQLLSAIERIAKSEAAAGNTPQEPTIKILESALATYNDPGLTTRVVRALSAGLGQSKIREEPPQMGSEDFSKYSQSGVPSVLLWVGTVEPKKFEQAKSSGAPLPGPHSALFAPEREPTIRTGVSVLTLTALDLLGKSDARTSR
jgi:amidohydrolase